MLDTVTYLHVHSVGERLKCYSSVIHLYSMWV